MSQQGFPFNFSSAGSMNNPNYFNLDLNPNQEGVDETKTTDPRRDGTKIHVDRLYQLTSIPRPGETIVVRKSGRKNKNEILGLTLARLTKEKYLSDGKFSEQVELTRGIPMRVNNRCFVMVLNSQGRVVAMSDDVEHHLGKPMRSLYTQCINIFQCLKEEDAAKLKSIFKSSSNPTLEEHRLVCTFHLPKGKRPSRAREDIKTIMMAGHFYTHHSAASEEKLFIARCEALVSGTTNKSSSSQTSSMIINHSTTQDHTTSMLKITLKEDMTIDFASSNVKDILAYSANEMITNWFGRYIPSEDVAKIEAIRQKYFQEQLPTSVCDLFDIYANHGESRLTFLCQIRPMRERRSKTVKFHIIAQLIDPSLREEYVTHLRIDSGTSPKSIKAEQYHDQSRKRAKTQSWSTVQPSTWGSSSTTMTSTFVNNSLQLLDPFQMLDPSTSLINPGNISSTSIAINIPSITVSPRGQQNPSMTHLTNTKTDTI